MILRRASRTDPRFVLGSALAFVLPLGANLAAFAQDSSTPAAQVPSPSVVPAPGTPAKPDLNALKNADGVKVQSSGGSGYYYIAVSMKDPTLANPKVRLAIRSLIDYDAAGNQTKDYLTWNGTRTYDAENRMITASNGVSNSYSYDADGRRVKRVSGPTETWQVYGASGELLAEYAANAAAIPRGMTSSRNGSIPAARKARP